MKKSLFCFALICTLPAFADWKLETVNGTQVHYYVPKTNGFIQKNTKKSLMINLHGCSQKAEDLKKDGNWENSADEFNMVVSLPKVPNGGVYSGCWDYYGADHTENNRHNVHVLAVVRSLLAKNELNIDPSQVYISGLSSGGGLSMILGCMAPDVFAGMGLNAAPSSGTSANEISRPKTSYEKMFSACKNLGEKKTDFFKTQLTSIIYGNNDYIVSQSFNTHNAEIMKTLYGASVKSTFDTTKLEGANNAGNGTLWSDDKGARISVIMNTGLGHNWPAGQGGNSGSYINKKSLNYPHYLAHFFTTNNRRSQFISLPELLIDPPVVKNSQFIISGEFTIDRTLVKEINVKVVQKTTQQIVDHFKVSLDDHKGFLGFSKKLPEGEYDFSVELLATQGQSRLFKRNSWLGEVEGVNAPQLVNTHYSSVQGCLNLKGQAISADGSTLKGVTVIIDQNSPFFIDVGNDTKWSFSDCQLGQGDHSADVYVESELGNRSNAQQIHFKTAKDLAISPLQEHMETKRLNWSDYGSWYNKYGHSHFSLYLGDDGIWHD